MRDALQAEWEYQLRTYPEFATYVGDTRYNDRLGDYSPEAIAKQVEHAKQQLKVFEAIDTSGFPDEEVLNQQLMVRDLREDVEGAKFNNWEMPVNQFWGVHLNYASMPTQMPFKTVQDYKNYITRLHQLPRVFDQVTEDMKLGLRDQLMPPKFLLEKVTVQAQEIADATDLKSPFMQPVLQFPEGFSPADLQRLREEVRKTVKAEVNPAYAKFAAFVKNDYAPKGRTEMGVWSLPDGDARYQYEVRHMTTTSFQPEEIHQMGLKQVADLEPQMLAIAKQQGFADLKSFNDAHPPGPQAARHFGPADSRPVSALHRPDVPQAAATVWPAAEEQAGAWSPWKPSARPTRSPPTTRWEPATARVPAAST